MNISFFEDNLSVKMLHTAQLNQVIMELIEDMDLSKADKERIVSDILTRESIMSTYQTDGVMMPRVGIDEGESGIIIGITKSNVHYNDMHINVIVLFLYREDSRHEFIDSLALMSRLFLWRTIRTGIRNTDDEDEVKQLILEGLRTIDD